MSEGRRYKVIYVAFELLEAALLGQGGLFTGVSNLPLDIRIVKVFQNDNDWIGHRRFGVIVESSLWPILEAGEKIPEQDVVIKQ